MADYSGIGALGNGLSSFADSYIAAKKQKQSQDLQDAYLANTQAQTQAGLLAKNMQQDPITGQVQYNQQGLLNQQNEQAQAGIQQKTLQQQNDAFDPNSDYAQQHRVANRALLDQIAPGKSQQIYPDSMSPAQFENSGVGALVKDYAPIASAKVKGQFGEDNTRLKLTGTADKATDKQFQDLSNAIDPNKGRAGNLATLQQQKNLADRLKALVANGNNLDSRQQEELAISMQKLLSGGGAGSSNEVSALVPKTAQGDFQKMKEFLFNSPQGLNNQDFVNKMMDTVDRERGVASQQLRDASYGKVAAFDKLDQKDHDTFKKILDGQGDLGYDDYQAWKQEKASQKGGGLLGGAGKPGGSQVQGGFSQDVIDYAKAHGIQPAQAQSIKEQRMKSMQNPSPGGV